MTTPLPVKPYSPHVFVALTFSRPHVGRRGAGRRLGKRQLLVQLDALDRRMLGEAIEGRAADGGGEPVEDPERADVAGAAGVRLRVEQAADARRVRSAFSFSASTTARTRAERP